VFIDLISYIMGRAFGPAFKMVNDAKASAPARTPPTGQAKSTPARQIYRPSNRSV
jgi:hypothetical protein